MTAGGPVGVLLMAYGTPRTPEGITAYYTDIRRGRPPTDEQRAVLQAARDARAAGGYVVELGLKHADPKIEAGVAALAARGVARIVGLVLAPHYSALSVGQYHERASAAAAEHGLDFVGIRSWAAEPAYVEFLAGEVARRLPALPANTKVLFTAHSLPARVLELGDPYPEELRATAEAVARAAGLAPWSQWSVAWQSAGRTPEPWLGPDVLAVNDTLGSAENADGVLVCPCGFVADHLEVLYDLDIEARQRAEAAGLTFDRTASLNAHPGVLDALAERIIAAAR